MNWWGDVRQPIRNGDAASQCDSGPIRRRDTELKTSVRSLLIAVLKGKGEGRRGTRVTEVN